MLVPLLYVAGVGGAGVVGAGTSGRSVGWARTIFEAVGLPLTLRAMLIVYVGIVAITAALAAYRSVLLVRYRLVFIDDLRSRLYAAVAYAEWRHLLALRQSDLLTVITVNVNQVGMAALAVLNLGVTAIVVAVQLAVAFRISPSITALAAVTGAVLTVIVWPLVRRSRRLGVQLVENNRGVLESVTGFLDGLQLAKVHGLETGHVTSFDEAIRRTRSSQIDYSKVSSAASAVQLVVTAIVLAVLVGVAIEQLRMPLAELLVLAFVFTRIVPQITSAQTTSNERPRDFPRSMRSSR